MKKLLYIIICISLFLPAYTWGQRSCGYDIIHKAALAKNPNFDADREAYLQSTYKASGTAKKTTATTVWVPVIFHIVLDNANLTQMDASTIQDRVNTQIAVLNEDYDRGNADSVNIPAAFKPLYASTNIKFAATRIDPNGNPTPGYEVINTTNASVDIFTNAGGAAKHTSSGGADAWDVTKYINVWVVNISSGVIGLTVPPSYTPSTYPANEMGILLSYAAFGRRTSSGEYFLPSGTGTPFDKGRTLTHEMGHYFELLHTWGDDGGACPGSGGTDDGIADTPPQGTNTSGCPSGVKTDACSSTSPGVMYQNYLDYTDDACMCMFTIDQAAKMYVNLQGPSGETYPLTTHHELLSVPGVNTIAHDVLVSPNPTTGKITISFPKAESNLLSISIINTVGQEIKTISTNQSSNYYTADISGMPTGMYFVVCDYTDGKEVRKILLQ